MRGISDRPRVPRHRAAPNNINWATFEHPIIQVDPGSGGKYRVCRVCNDSSRIPIKNYLQHMKKAHGCDVLLRDNQKMKSVAAASQEVDHASDSSPCKTEPEKLKKPIQLPLSISHLRRDYVLNLAMFKEQCQLKLQEMISICDGNKSIRAAEEIPDYQELIKECRISRPLTMEEYRNSSQEDIDSAGFLFLTAEEAHDILESGSPSIPLFIPASLNKDPRKLLSIEDATRSLRAFDEISIHSILSGVSGGHSKSVKTLYHTKMPTDGIMKCLTDGNAVIKSIDLPVVHQNLVPAIVVDLPQYNILEGVGEPTARPQKARQKPNTNLPPSTLFQTLRTSGYFSLPHIETNGVITIIRVEEGRMLWPTWDRMNRSDFEEWIVDGTLPNDPFLICAEPGDMIIQPAGTVHAPMALTAALVTGHKCWNSVSMVRTMEMLWIESCNENITNEQSLRDFVPKLERIRNLWMENCIAFPWSDNGEDFELFEQYLRACGQCISVYGAAFANTQEQEYRDTKGCSCENECTKCICVKENRKCTLRCHKTNPRRHKLCGNSLLCMEE